MSYHYDGYGSSRGPPRGTADYYGDGGRRRYEPYGYPLRQSEETSRSAYYAADGIGPSRSSHPTRQPLHEEGRGRSSLGRSALLSSNAVTKSHKDFGFAFVGREGERRAKQIVKDSEAALSASNSSLNAMPASSKGNLTPLQALPASSAVSHVASTSSDVHGDTTPTPLPMTTRSNSILTPTMIVDEFKRAGHFDAIRKKLLQAFNEKTGNSGSGDGSNDPQVSFKTEFLDTIGDYLLQRLVKLPDEARQNLAKREARLQHSEVTRWIDEDARGVKVMGDAVENLRNGGIITGEKIGAKDHGQNHESVDVFMKEKLQEIVRSERKARGLTEDKGAERAQSQENTTIPGSDDSVRRSDDVEKSSFPVDGEAGKDAIDPLVVESKPAALENHHHHSSSTTASAALQER